MPTEIYLDTGLGRRVRKITQAATAGLRHLYSHLFTSIDVRPPVNLVVPVVSGSTTVGSILSTTPGNWSGNPVITQQWKVNGADAVGQTNTTFDTTGLNPGDLVKCEVTATNAGGGVSVESNEVTLT